MTQAILFMALVPLALLLVLAFVLLGKRMSEKTRKRVEIGLTLFLYPAIILNSAWAAWDAHQEGDWSGLGAMLALAGLFTIQFVVAVRSRTLFPRYGHPKA